MTPNSDSNLPAIATGNPYAAMLANVPPPTMPTGLQLAGEQYEGGTYLPYLKPISSLSAEFMSRLAQIGDVCIVKDNVARVLLPAPAGGIEDPDPNGPIAQVQVIAWRMRIFDMRDKDKDLWKVYTDPAHPKWSELQAIGEQAGKNNVLFGPEILLAVLTEASHDPAKHGQRHPVPILATLHLTSTNRSQGDRFAQSSIYFSTDPTGNQSGKVCGLQGRVAKNSKGTWGSYGLLTPNELAAAIEGSDIITDPLPSEVIQTALVAWENGRGEPLPT